VEAAPEAALLAGVLLGTLFVLWYVLTSPRCCRRSTSPSPIKAAFFFGEPLKVLERLWAGSPPRDLRHLWVTLIETLLAFLIGTVLGVVFGLWLALAPLRRRSSTRNQRRQRHAR